MTPEQARAKAEEVQRWVPYMHYVWTKVQLAAWYDTFGAWAMYDGRMWKPKVKRLHVGRYEVRFEEYVP